MELKRQSEIEKNGNHITPLPSFHEQTLTKNDFSSETSKEAKERMPIPGGIMVQQW